MSYVFKTCVNWDWNTESSSQLEILSTKQLVSDLFIIVNEIVLKILILSGDFTEGITFTQGTPTFHAIIKNSFEEI